MTAINKIHCIVEGKVQGVGFRWFVQKLAHRFEIKGWVKNLADGSVEIEAHGKKDNLNLFLNALREEHSMALVSDISTQWHTVSKEEFIDFEIIF